MADLFVESNASKPTIVATYPYRDEQGKLLFEVVRYSPKDFKQRCPGGHGRWSWNLNGVRRVLYNLPELIKSELVMVCEGEKDCETAKRLGFVATCNPGGAGKWRPEYSECLRAKRIFIIPDRDEPGRNHAHDVARSVIGVAESVKILELPAGKDLSEWARPVGTGTSDELLALINGATHRSGADVGQWQRNPSFDSPPGFQLATLGEIMKEPDEQVSWLVDGLLPAGGLSLLAAKPKVGKSTLARCLALAVARGEEFLGRSVVSGPVIYLALEEKRAEVKRHFVGLGASGEEQIHIHCAAAPQDALAALHEEIKHRKPVLVIIDPILRMARIKDANDYVQVTNALEPLMSFAREYGAHLLMVYHLGKGERSEASDSILGSTAFFASVDTALIMKPLERHRTIQSRQRYGNDLPETILDFDPERRAVSLGLQRSEAESQRVSEAILDFLRTSNQPRTEQEIEEAVEGRTTVKRATLRQLLADANIKRQGSGKRGSPYVYEFSFSCSQETPGTREQEMPKAADSP
jgi:hypothetical protein